MSQNHTEIQQAVLSFGRSAFSFDVFEAPADYLWFSFQGKHGRGGIAYKEACFTRVIVGDPLLPREDWEDAMVAFLAAGRRFRPTIATFASPDFAQVALKTKGAAIDAQTAVNVNPQTWEPVGPTTARIRQFSRKCEKEGLVIVKLKNAQAPDPSFRAAADKLVADWKQNSLKRQGNVHNINLWEACERKQFIALMDPKSGDFHALVVARPLPVKQGYYLWSARASKCLTGSLEATIAGAIRSMREDGVTFLTFGPFQAARAHVYIGDSGGTPFSRWALRTLVPKGIEQRGFHHTMNFFKKFGFPDSEAVFNLTWPRWSWIRPYAALNSLFTSGH